MNSLDKKNKATIIFARFPAEGKVKTRLAKDIGDKDAAAFYRICAEHLFDEVGGLKKSGIDLFLFYSDNSETERMKKWVGDNFCYYQQTGVDLGEKMLNAFDLVFAKGYEKVIIIGTDVPDMNSLLLEEAFEVLDKNNFVIGPSDDGGYYLLGMKSPTTDLFTGIEWGTGTVYNSTINKLNRKNARYKIIGKMMDIDTKTDLINWFNKSGVNHPVRKFIESIKPDN